MKKSYSFYCHELNRAKYDLLYSKAIELRNFRNKISKTVCKSVNTFIEFSNMGKYDWINHFRCRLNGCNNHDISRAITDVFVAYENKREQLNKALKLYVQDEFIVKKYKKNTKTHKIGDVIDTELKMKSTPITQAISYLCRYWNDGLIEFLRNSNDSDVDKQKFRYDILAVYDKFPTRITNIVNGIRCRVISKIIEHPIEFTSLTYSSFNELIKPIINRNTNTQSKYNAIVTLGGQATNDGKLHIPVKFSLSHHGNITEYKTGQNKKGKYVTFYTVVFLNKCKIRLVLTKSDSDLILQETNQFYGIDVNIKHNLFCDKYGNSIDFDRELFNDYITHLKKVDAKNNRKRTLGLNITMSTKDKSKHEKWVSRIKDMLKRKSNALVQQAILLGKDHIIMEDLGDFAKSFTRSDEFDGFKYSRLVKLLNLADLKNIVTSIANKRGINVSFVHSHYTSKGCICGNITNENRKTQELFQCTECGIQMNADIHSSDMIEQRVSVNVLRTEMLSKCGSHFEPKKISKFKIKTTLYDYYANKQQLISLDKSNDIILNNHF